MAPQQSSVSSTATIHHDLAPFLKLPLELREAIYTLLSTLDNDIDARTLKSDQRRLQFTLYTPAPPQAYLICRQITSELHDYVKRTGSRKFILQDDLLPRYYPDIKPAYRNLGVPLEASLVSTCSYGSGNSTDKWTCEPGGECSAARCISYHDMDLKRLVTNPLGHLPAFKIDFYVTWDEADTAEWPHSRHDRRLKGAVEHTVRWSGVTELRVFKLYESGKDDSGSQRDVWVSWSKERGWDPALPDASG